MKGKELLLAALRNEPTPRPAWLPFVGCHGGKIIGQSASTYLRSASLIVAGLNKAAQLYEPDGLPVMFDLQLEAEILGCDLQWADEVPPSVVTHPLAHQPLSALPEFDTRRGRLPVVMDALQQVKRDLGHDVALYGLICGPFTLAAHLFGSDIFLAMFDRPEYVSEVIDYCAGIGIRMADLYLEHGADVIAVVDPMTSQISPRHFEQFVTPSVNRLFDAIRARRAYSSLFVCGDVTRNLEVMCKTRADNISVDEQIDLERLRMLCGREGKSFGGNLRLTAVLLLGDENDACLEAVQVMDKGGSRGFILAPGCDLPYHVPEKNLQAVARMVRDSYQRDVARNTLRSRTDACAAEVMLPDYQARHSVVIDVITLDSTSCAPCQYMMEAVKHAVQTTPIRVYINEHKIKVREGLGMMMRLGVRNLPTICIDGEIKFASIIPDQKTLVAAIEEAARKKMSS
jgi:uroporphyrinogen decarboxylase